MTTKELEKQIVKAIKEESKIKLVRKLFKKFKDDREYLTSTIVGMTKELER